VTYEPVDCALHDRLEAAATLRRTVTLRYAGPEGEVELTAARIVDIRARDCVEYLELDSGVEMRLDRILEMDGVAFRGGGC
jgi:Rho-binding antiterminator